MRHVDAFVLEHFPKSHAILQAGAQPPLRTARLYLIIEGEVRNIYPAQVAQRGRRTRGAKADARSVARRGQLLGEAAVFGERYACSAVVVEPVKVLTLRVYDYLERFL